MSHKKSSLPRCYSYIRFSTPDQLKGDSLNRQLKLSEDYANEKGLILDDSLKMTDLGLSAFSGEHRTKGALGKFLGLVKSGKIPENSFLLVESLDRLSREQVLDAFQQFIDIIKSGITIITLTDGMEYSREALNANIGQLMISLTIMARAHEESEMKSKRLKAAWKSKRENIDKKPLTRTVPAWLKLNTDTQVIEIIDERAKIVERIFNLSRNGRGVGSIAKMLNKDGVPTWKGKNGWHSSYIQKILHNRGVLGEFQPHVKKNKKRIPVGEPIQDYYPRVISDTLYYEARARMRRDFNGGGKMGKVHNLFATIVKCGYCGAPMQFVNKGKSPNRGKYLVCDSARRGRGCDYISFRYQEFENAFLTFCSELDIKDLISSHRSEKEHAIAEIKGEINSLAEQIRAVDIKIENLDYQLSIAKLKSAIDHITKNLEAAFSEKDTLNSTKAKLEKKAAKLTSQEKTTSRHLESVKQLLKTMATETGSKLIDMRLKLRTEIRQLVQRIDVFPNGMSGKLISWNYPDFSYKDIYDESSLPYYEETGFDPDHFPDFESFHDAYLKEKKEVEEYIKNNTGREHRCFTIFFRNGSFKAINKGESGFEVNVEKNEKLVRIGKFVIEDKKSPGFYKDGSDLYLI